MLGLLIVGVTELFRSPEDRADLKARETERVTRMERDRAIRTELAARAAEERRIRNGLPARQIRRRPR